MLIGLPFTSHEQFHINLTEYAHYSAVFKFRWFAIAEEAF